MKKYWKDITLISLTILVAVPLAVAFMVSFRFMVTDTSNDWIGFWGGYLGALIGGLITLYVMRETLKTERSISYREEKTDFFNSIVKLSVEMSSEIGNLGIVTSRDVKENAEDLHQKSLNTCNTVARLNEEIEILLETRRDIYEVEELYRKTIDLGYSIDRMIDFYEMAVKSSFKTCVNEYNNEKKLVGKFEEEYMDCLKETVKENLK